MPIFNWLKATSKTTQVPVDPAIAARLAPVTAPASTIAPPPATANTSAATALALVSGVRQRKKATLGSAGTSQFPRMAPTPGTATPRTLIGGGY